MTETFTESIPMKIPSLGNMSCHWSRKFTIKKKQKNDIKFYLYQYDDIFKNHEKFDITLTRCYPRKLDEDNLVASMKYISDAIAELINPGLAAGRADGVGNITFNYAQERSPKKELRIDVVAN